MLTEEQRRAICINFIGYGIPNSNVWFMGIDEAKSSGENEREDALKRDDSFILYSKYDFVYYNSFIKAIGNNKYADSIPSDTYGGYKKILEKYFIANLFQGNYFMTNLYPFSRCKNDKGNNELISKEDQIYFGFKSNKFRESMEDSQYDIVPKRIKALKQFFERYNWKDKYIFFCVGNGIYEKFYDDNFINFLKILYNQETLELDLEMSLPQKLSDKKFWLHHASGRSFGNNNVFLEQHFTNS